MRLVVAGGGTAGHVEPALNLADALRAADPTAQVTALGTAAGLETTLVPARGYPLELVPAVPLPRRPSRDLLTLPSRLRIAVRAVRTVLERTEADVLVGFGGYVALPGYLGARGRVPIVVHEANARAGLANRVGARLTPYVAETVAGSLPRARLTGIPLRAELATLDRVAARPAARAGFGLDPAAPTLLVSGGSQGARQLNAAVGAALPGLLAAGVQVLHVVGARNTDQQAPQQPGYVAVPYVERMADAYAAADLMLCRAGAMTCAELAAVGLPAIYVPLPIGNGEQRLNALPVVTAGGGILVPDAELTGERVVGESLRLLDPERLARAGAAARAHGSPDAAARLLDLVRAAVGGRAVSTDAGTEGAR
ncbi:MAG TPA: undecaprenyldiphospho-muramoylpentapeptide beta-N-acetylglucosaminyltransferase [Candidatus Nanopelagicales bacterium]|jgi:UDP-N-acetylglucosamine--N-acetylmuramyl-(pentapeptide) pyrophosphoryl-undecaprenol N-acetylglucosamine transferase|nr:undecaprenyldiphospho-muramoylpentapeptide beta-N-acetylglucosaminyltransferase [Candidatus Nanopelagicales bacterium]